MKKDDDAQIDRLQGCLEASFSIECDNCGDGEACCGRTLERAAKELVENGWATNEDGYPLCPLCAEADRVNLSGRSGMKKGMRMTKEELIEKLGDLQDVADREYAHIVADKALIEYINDAGIKAAYEAVDKCYA